jgi:enoyl-CoA hydratase/carnithine racemase
MIVASENSVFSLPEVTRGLVAAAGGIYRLPRAIPRAVAFELIATGDRIAASRAAELGLVNRVAPQGEAVGQAIAFAKRINENAPIAVRESLGLARQAYDMSDDALFALGLEAQKRIMTTEDFAEGPRAFVEKRAPQWRGR